MAVTGEKGCRCPPNREFSAKSPGQGMSGQRGNGPIIAGDSPVENAILWENMLMTVDGLSCDRLVSGSGGLPDHDRHGFAASNR
jgi:hypothetical protein